MKRKKPLRRTPMKKKKRKGTGIAPLFLEIWAERPHVCFGCGKTLNDPPKNHFFSHRKHRGMGGCKSANTKDNIDLTCYACHTERDTGKRPIGTDWLDG